MMCSARVQPLPPFPFPQNLPPVWLSSAYCEDHGVCTRTGPCVLRWLGAAERSGGLHGPPAAGAAEQCTSTPSMSAVQGGARALFLSLGLPQHDAGRLPRARGALCLGCCVLLVPGRFGPVGWPAGRAPAGWMALRAARGGPPGASRGGAGPCAACSARQLCFPAGPTCLLHRRGGRMLGGLPADESIFGRGPVGLATDCGVHLSRQRLAQRWSPRAVAQEVGLH